MDIGHNNVLVGSPLTLSYRARSRRRKKSSISLAVATKCPQCEAFFFPQANLLGPLATVLHRSMCLVKVRYGKFPFIIVRIILVQIETFRIFFLLLFLVLFDWLNFEGEEQVGLKSCQSCVSALRHSQNVFFCFCFVFSLVGAGG